MKYQFMTVDKTCVGDSTDQIIPDVPLKEYLRAFPKDDCMTFGEYWYGYDDGDYIYIWRKV